MEEKNVIQQDWHDREFVTTVHFGMNKLVSFLNRFEAEARFKLAMVNEQLTRLERNCEFVEAILKHHDPSDRGAKRSSAKGTVFDREWRENEVQRKLQRQGPPKPIVKTISSKKQQGRIINVGAVKAVGGTAEMKEPPARAVPVKQPPAQMPGESKVEEKSADPMAKKPPFETPGEPDVESEPPKPPNQPPKAPGAQVLPPAQPGAGASMVPPTAPPMVPPAVPPPGPPGVSQPGGPPVPPTGPAINMPGPPPMSQPQVLTPPPGPGVGGPPPGPGVPPPGPGAAPSRPPPGPGAAPSGPPPGPGAAPSGPPPGPGAAPSGPPPGPGAAPSGPPPGPGTTPTIISGPPTRPPPQPVVEDAKYSDDEESSYEDPPIIEFNPPIPEDHNDVWIQRVNPGNTKKPGPNPNSNLMIAYIGWIKNSGECFDEIDDYSIIMGSGDNIVGLEKILLKMKEGETILAYIPSQLGYGDEGAGDLIPPNSDLVFQLTLSKID